MSLYQTTCSPIRPTTQNPPPRSPQGGSFHFRGRMRIMAQSANASALIWDSPSVISVVSSSCGIGNQSQSSMAVEVAERLVQSRCNIDQITRPNSSRRESNPRPRAYKARALTTELREAMNRVRMSSIIGCSRFQETNQGTDVPRSHDSIPIRRDQNNSLITSPSPKVPVSLMGRPLGERSSVLGSMASDL